MDNPKHNIIQLAFCATLAGGTLLWASPVPAGVVQAQDASRRMNNIEVSGRFLQEWSKQGSEQSSLYVNGLPITSRRPEISLEDGKPYDTQWFERARYEAHPDNKPPYDVLLGRLGSSISEGRAHVNPDVKVPPGPFAGIDKPADVDGKSKVWFPETKHSISGKILEYWNRYGGLQQFGFPLSEPFQEVSQADGKPYTVQYFERNRMELHPEKAAPYDVELGLLGVEQFGMQAVPGDQLPLSPPKDARTTKDTIIVGMSRDPANLSLADNSPEARRIRSLIEDQLVGRDENENLFPLNAWYVPTLENGGARFIGQDENRYLQVKYKLRQGIQWSDGVELTSNDAIFAYRLMLDPSIPVPNRSEYQKLLYIDNPDKYTIIYNYRPFTAARIFYNAQPDKENYDFLKLFIDLKKPVISRAYSEIGIVYPEHVLGKIPPDKIPESDAASAPISTGPWKVESWAKKQSMVLVPNEHYSLTAKPLIKKITIKFIGDFSSNIGVVKTGVLDMLTSELFPNPPLDRAGLEAAGYKVAGRPASTWEHLDFSHYYNPFNEKAVREAIITAINRQRIVDTLYQGMAGVMNSVIPPGVYFSLDNPNFAKNYPDIADKYKLPIYQYNPDKAALLLDGAGWKCPSGVANTKNCDGKPREKGGIKLSFEYGTTTQAVRQQMQGLVSEDLKAVGMDAVTKNYPAGVFFAGDNTDPRVTGKTKLIQASWVGTRDSDFSNWLCVNWWDPSWGGLQDPYPCLARRDLQIANDTFNAEIDAHTQITAAAQAQVILIGEVITIPLVERPNIEVVKNTLASYKLPNSLTSSFWNARQWYFK